MLSDGKGREEVVYNRDIFTAVLIYHWSTATSGCGCGWATLGASYAEHVADVYEACVNAMTP